MDLFGLLEEIENNYAEGNSVILMEIYFTKCWLQNGLRNCKYYVLFNA